MPTERSPGPRERALFAREVWPWALLGMTCGLVEGGTVAVLAKRGYTGLVAEHWVNFAVAAVSGAPALANLASFAWANLAHGRARIGVLAAVQMAFALAVGLIGLAPARAHGLVLTIFAVLAARLLWAGILTVRSAVWSANYPRHLMAQMTGRIVVASSLGVAFVSMLAGWILDRHAASARWLYLFAALAGGTAALRYRSVRVRREYALLAAEGEAGPAASTFSLGVLREILHGDPDFRAYMFWLSLYGAGNLMMGAQLVVMFNDRLHLPGIVQIGVLTVLPLAITPLALPAWAALFDRGHVIAYRARQCWALVGAVIVYSVAVLSRQAWLLWPASVLYGISVAGANIGWNLGHNDFAPLGRVQHYMGVHVTLTGVRGLVAPPLGMACYQALEWWHPGWGVGSMLLPVALVTAGALGFQGMAVPQRRRDDNR